MKTNLMSLRDKLCFSALVATCLALFVSCAQDGYDDDEKWESSVKNTQLVSPDASDITITSTTDGATTIISWNVIHGAGGYICSLYDVSDTENPIVVDEIENQLVDGCSLTASREEDTNYKFVIRTAGNEELNNTEATTTTEVEFTSFVESYATIPAGSDLAAWFTANPWPESLDDDTELYYDLEPGGSYTMSAAIDFASTAITLRTTSQTDHAVVTFTGTDVCFLTKSGLTLKYIDFECSTSLVPFIMMNSSPDADMLGATGSGSYYNIQDAVYLCGCNIENLNYGIIHSNGVKYCLETFMVSNCNIHLTVSAEANASNHAAVYFYNGFINTLDFKNSTVWNTGDSDMNYFVQYSNDGRCTRAGYTSNTVSYDNCSFYNLAKSGQWANYSAFKGQSTSTWVMTENIFVDCGNKQICRRFLAGQGNQSTATFKYNTYMFDGEFESTDGSVSGYDDSGTAIEEDPLWTDPANGDFTVGGAAQIEKETGDPRWLPSAE